MSSPSRSEELEKVRARIQKALQGDATWTAFALQHLERHLDAHPDQWFAFAINIQLAFQALPTQTQTQCTSEDCPANIFDSDHKLTHEERWDRYCQYAARAPQSKPDGWVCK